MVRCECGNDQVKLDWDNQMVCMDCETPMDDWPEYKEWLKSDEAKAIDKRIAMGWCPHCGTTFTKWRFCLKCGHINHRYTNKNYIGEGE